MGLLFSRNLVHKTIAGMQYASQHFPSTWFYSSADDDLIPDIASIRAELVNIMSTTNAIVSTNERSNCTFEDQYPILCGFDFIPNAVVRRSKASKWPIPKELYPLNFYPTYCGGPWISMRMKLVNGLYALSRKSKQQFWIEDVWTSGFLRLKYFANLAQGCFLDDINVGIWPKSCKRCVMMEKSHYG